MYDRSMRSITTRYLLFSSKYESNKKNEEEEEEDGKNRFLESRSFLLPVHRAAAKFEWISTKKRTTNPPDNASIFVFNVSPVTTLPDIPE